MKHFLQGNIRFGTPEVIAHCWHLNSGMLQVSTQAVSVALCRLYNQQGCIFQPVFLKQPNEEHCPS